MNLSWLDDFHILAAHGHFSRAAEARHMTQPAFSRRVRALEAWLGTDLFDRSEQPARLTAAGEWFRTASQDLQARVAALPGEARAVADAQAATLRFAATHALSFTFLPRWLQGLETRTPLGQLQLMSDTQRQCERLLAEQQVQFLVAHAHPGVAGPLDDAGFVHCVVGGDRLLPVAAPAEPGRARHRLPASAAVEPTPSLDYSDESGLGRILRALKGPALDRLPLQPVLTAHLASVLRTMALDGRGLAWLPRALVADDLASGRLVQAAGDEWVIDLQIRLYRGRGPSSRAAQAFWDAVSAAG